LALIFSAARGTRKEPSFSNASIFSLAEVASETTKRRPRLPVNLQSVVKKEGGEPVPLWSYGFYELA
jgi:hypothetical protein